MQQIHSSGSKVWKLGRHIEDETSKLYICLFCCFRSSPVSDKASKLNSPDKKTNRIVYKETVKTYTRALNAGRLDANTHLRSRDVLLPRPRPCFRGATRMIWKSCHISKCDMKDSIEPGTRTEGKLYPNFISKASITIQWFCTIVTLLLCWDFTILRFNLKTDVQVARCNESKRIVLISHISTYRFGREIKLQYLALL